MAMTKVKGNLFSLVFLWRRAALISKRHMHVCYNIDYLKYFIFLLFVLIDFDLFSVGVSLCYVPFETVQVWRVKSFSGDSDQAYVLHFLLTKCWLPLMTNVFIWYLFTCTHPWKIKEDKYLHEINQRQSMAG